MRKPSGSSPQVKVKECISDVVSGKTIASFLREILLILGQFLHDKEALIPA